MSRLDNSCLKSTVDLSDLLILFYASFRLITRGNCDYNVYGILKYPSISLLLFILLNLLARFLISSRCYN